MTNKQTKRLMEYIKHSGEKAIILDSESDALFVMLPLDEYEELTGESGNDDFDLSGNNDLDFNTWAGGGDAPNLASDFIDNNLSLDDKKDKEKESDGLNDLEAFSAIEPQADAPGKPASKLEDFSTDNQNDAVLSEESLSDVMHEEEEEKFYLEPIE